MATYHVEMEHTVYVVVEVEADSKEKAIELAHSVTSTQECGTSVEFDVE